MLTPHGEVDVDTERVFETTICTALASRPVVVDLSRLRFFAISSLSSLVRAQMVADAGEHPLLYVDPPPTMRMLLALSRVEHQIDLRVDTEPERRTAAPAGTVTKAG